MDVTHFGLADRVTCINLGCLSRLLKSWVDGNQTVFILISVNFSGNIPAIHDTWIVGDTFLREIYPTFQAMETQAVQSKKSPPYAFEYFKVFPFYSSNLQYSRNVLTRIQNAIVEAFNRRERLPQYMIIIMDKDIVEAAEHFTFGVKKIFDRWHKWLETTIQRFIAIRKE